jgi:iron complex transport system ATP-binding protein
MNPGAEALRLDIEGLSLRAGGSAHGRVLFDALSFGVHAGERWVVLGPNGSGKSSLLAALGGVFALAGGRVLLQARSLGDWRADTLADWRAWCPQFWSDPFPSTVEETARLATRRGAWWAGSAQADTASVRQVLGELDLLGLANTDVRQLSGGERQRVAVATALLQDTPLLLLDEPASHLDLAHQQLLLQLLARHCERQRAVVVSLHDMNLAWDLATHAVLLDGHGHAIAGPRADVMTPPHLAHSFGVSIDQVEVCGQTRFWVGPLRRPPSS